MESCHLACGQPSPSDLGRLKEEYCTCLKFDYQQICTRYSSYICRLTWEWYGMRMPKVIHAHLYFICLQFVIYFNFGGFKAVTYITLDRLRAKKAKE